VFATIDPLLDWAILWNVPSRPEIIGGNWPVVIVEAASYLALSLLMTVSFIGADSSIVSSVLSAVIFAILGVATLVFTYRVYSLVWVWFGTCDIDAQIGNRCYAAAVDAGSFILSLIIILAFSIAGDSMGLWQDFVSYLRYVVIGVLAIATIRSFVVLGTWVTRQAVGWRWLRATHTHHGRVGVSLFIGSISVIAALAIGIGIV
jgi:hypothetical protein